MGLNIKKEKQAEQQPPPTRKKQIVKKEVKEVKEEVKKKKPVKPAVKPPVKPKPVKPEPAIKPEPEPKPGVTGQEPEKDKKEVTKAVDEPKIEKGFLPAFVERPWGELGAAEKEKKKIEEERRRRIIEEAGKEAAEATKEIEEYFAKQRQLREKEEEKVPEMVAEDKKELEKKDQKKLPKKKKWTERITEGLTKFGKGIEKFIVGEPATPEAKERAWSRLLAGALVGFGGEEAIRPLIEERRKARELERAFEAKRREEEIKAEAKKKEWLPVPATLVKEYNIPETLPPDVWAKVVGDLIRPGKEADTITIDNTLIEAIRKLYPGQVGLWEAKKDRSITGAEFDRLWKITSVKEAEAEKKIPVTKEIRERYNLSPEIKEIPEKLLIEVELKRKEDPQRDTITVDEKILSTIRSAYPNQYGMWIEYKGKNIPLSTFNALINLSEKAKDIEMKAEEAKEKKETDIKDIIDLKAAQHRLVKYAIELAAEGHPEMIKLAQNYIRQYLKVEPPPADVIVRMGEDKKLFTAFLERILQ